MALFPSLNTGAIAQYPLLKNAAQAAQVIRFLDGSDQRFRVQGQMFRQWQIRLDLLNENELQQLEEFFAAQLGSYSTFSFPDPFSVTDVPNCRFGAPGLMTAYVGPDCGSTSIWVIETNG